LSQPVSFMLTYDKKVERSPGNAHRASFLVGKRTFSLDQDRTQNDKMPCLLLSHPSFNCRDSLCWGGLSAGLTVFTIICVTGIFSFILLSVAD
jgi:hypothetical protein